MEHPMRAILAVLGLVAVPSVAVAQGAESYPGAKGAAVPCSAEQKAGRMREAGTEQGPATAESEKDAGAGNAACSLVQTSVSAGAVAPVQISGEPPIADPAQTRDALAATFAEAKRRAQSLRFEVGPPPRNLTRGTSPND
jgi:hypothetical protein